jgi:hypothetical protein
MSDRANWAALVPFSGIQKVPASIAQIAAMDIPATTVTVPLAAITVSGTRGQAVYINGIFIAAQYVAPT